MDELPLGAPLRPRAGTVSRRASEPAAACDEGTSRAALGALNQQGHRLAERCAIPQRDRRDVFGRRDRIRVMRSMTVVVWVVLGVGCGQAAPGGLDGSQGSQSAGTTVASRGVSLTLLDGWHADVARGRVEFQDYLGHGDPAPGQVHAFLSEYSAGLAASDGFRYPELAGPLTLRPGEFPSAQFARRAAPSTPRHHTTDTPLPRRPGSPQTPPFHHQDAGETKKVTPPHQIILVTPHARARRAGNH